MEILGIKFGIEKFARVLGAVALLMSMSACNGNSQTAATTTATTTGYTLTNGVCYVTGTSTAVATTYCTSTTSGYTLSGSVCYITGTTTVVATSYCSTTTGYYLVNGICYATATGTVVATTYCSTTTTTTTTGTTCLGPFYDPRVGQWGTCNGSNCHGVYLYNTSGSLVYCP